MKISTRSTQLFLFLFACLCNLLHSQNLYESKERTWKSMKDDVYMQEIGQKIKTNMPVQGIVLLKNRCFALIDGSINELHEDQFQEVKGAPNDINRIISIQNTLWVLAKNGIYLFKNDKWELIDDRIYVDLCLHQGKIHGATQEAIYKFVGNKFIDIKPNGGYNSSNITMLMEDGTQLHADPVRIGPIHKIQSYNSTLYILRPGKLILLDGNIVDTDHIDWGSLPSKVTRDLLSFGSKLFISTDRGLGVLRGASVFVLEGKDGLPYENTTCLEKGFDQDIWIGTTKGVIRKLEDDWHYFAADHWLPGDHVNDIAVGNNIVYVATNKGVGIIRYEEYTLKR